jgi:hypothetical protein
VRNDHRTRQSGLVWYKFCPAFLPGRVKDLTTEYQVSGSVRHGEAACDKPLSVLRLDSQHGRLFLENSQDLTVICVFLTATVSTSSPHNDFYVFDMLDHFVYCI